MSGWDGVLATCMPKPNRIVVSCDPGFYLERPAGSGKMCRILHSGGTHLTAQVSRYLSTCDASFFAIYNATLNDLCGQRPYKMQLPAQSAADSYAVEFSSVQMKLTTCLNAPSELHAAEFAS